MSNRTINPTFTAEGGRASFRVRAREINQVVLPLHLDEFGAIQQRYGLYSYATLTAKEKFRIMKLQAQPLMWQKHNSCNYEKTGTLNFGQEVIEPDSMYLFEQQCIDELFNSQFAHFVRFMNGELEVDADGAALQSAVIDYVTTMAVLNARQLAASGNLYNEAFVNENLNKDLPTRVLDAFRKTYRTTTGWVRTIEEAAASANSKNKAASVDNIFNAGEFNQNGDYEGSIVEIFDKMKKAASPNLRKFINKGSSILASARNYRALFVLSEAPFNSLVTEYNANASLVAQNRERLTRENFGGPGNPEYQFFIDGVPVVCLEDLNAYDQYFNGQTYYAGFVVTSVLNFGLSFSSLPEDVNASNEISLIVEQDTSISNGNYMQTSIMSFALIKAMISDLDYVCQTTFFKKAG